MLFLSLTVLLNVYVSAAFKLFPKFGIDNFQAIVVNYWVCSITGVLYAGSPYALPHLAQQPWLFWPILLGFFFITIFYLISYVTVHNGIATASVANKISLIIAVSISLVLYRESAHWLKLLAIAMAIPAVYLSFQKAESQARQSSLLWPALLFLGSGSLDALLQFVQHNYVRGAYETKLLPLGIFSTAAILGTSFLGYQLLLGKQKLAWKNVWAGILLGVPNYGSIYFFIRLLQSNYFESSTAIAVTNISVVVAAVIVAVVFFKEAMNAKRLIGIVLALLAIALIALSSSYA